MFRFIFSISTLMFVQICLSDVFSYAANNAKNPEEKANKIKALCYQEFNQYERKLIDHVIEELRKNFQLDNINQGLLSQRLSEFQDHIDSKLIDYFQLKGEKFIAKAKKNRSKYGITYDSYKLLTEI